jgi:hypothetical protein
VDQLRTVCAVLIVEADLKVRDMRELSRLPHVQPMQSPIHGVDLSDPAWKLWDLM